MAAIRDVKLPDGRVLRTYENGEQAPDSITILWHHGSPQTGAPLEPLVSAAAKRGIRLLSYGRPSYGGSSPQPGRTVASAAADVTAIVDALGIARFAVMGASGGGPHALACAALMPGRVSAVVCVASLAPLTDSFGWYAGMVSDEALRAATQGREARERFAATEEFDPNIFTPADWAALKAPWASLGADAERAGAAGPEGLIDDDVAFVSPWGFDLEHIDVPVLLVQGGQDRIVPAAHAQWLLSSIRSSELWLRPNDGHISVHNAIPVAMDWLRARDELVRARDGE